jgi:hypothetical protein
MDKNIADELSTHLEINTQKLDSIAAKLRETMSDEERKPYFEKIGHIMALSFDLFDLIGKEYPTLNPYKGHNKQ